MPYAIRLIFTAALLSLATFSANADGASEPTQSNLELYFASSLAGLHGHPTGIVGQNLDAAERQICRRRAALRQWIATQVGAKELDKLEEDFDEEIGQLYTAGIRVSIEQEWRIIRIARKALKELEKRKRAAVGDEAQRPEVEENYALGCHRYTDYTDAG